MEYSHPELCDACMIFSEAPLKYFVLLQVNSVAVREAVRKHLLSRIMVIKGLIGLLLIQGKYEIHHFSFFDDRYMPATF